MSKLLLCVRCRDVRMMKAWPHVVVCDCGEAKGVFAPDCHHSFVYGTGCALGIFNPDVHESIMSQESGYYPIRVWRIPDGDRIIVLNHNTLHAGHARQECWRCKPVCRMMDLVGDARKLFVPPEPNVELAPGPVVEVAPEPKKQKAKK